MFKRVSKKTGKPARWNQTEVLRVLENTAYIGNYVFSRYDSKNKVIRPESEWITINIPPLVDEETFNAAQKVRQSKRKQWKNGRVYDGPLLLIGLLKCGKCGASMVSSTGKGGKYTYYTCRTYLKEGKTGCSGHRVRARDFERHILEQIVSWAFSEESVKALIAEIRKVLLNKHRPVKELRAKIEDLDQRLNRYYSAFEAGTMNPEDMTDRVSELRAERNVLQNELAERTSIKELPADLGSPKNIAIIQGELKKIILNSTPQVVKRYLGFLVEHIVMNGEQVTITLKNEGILAVLEQKEKLSTGGFTPVLNSIYIWRPKCKAVKYSCTTIAYASISINTNILRFNPVQIGEWLAELLERGVFKSRRDMAHEFGLHHSRIGQFLSLMKLPAKERRQYKEDGEVREYQLRALCCG